MYPSKTRQYKESIVEHFYNCPMKGPVIVTTLAGPDFDRVINLADKYLNPKEINSYEIDQNTFNKQLAQYSFLDEKIQEKTNVYNLDVNKCIVSNFMDIDLMGTVLTQRSTVHHLLNQQKHLKGDKCFIATFSIRAVGLKRTFNQVRDIIGITLHSYVKIYDAIIENETRGTWIYLNKFKTSCKNRIKSFDIYHYSDKEGPMVTFRILYK